MNSKQPGQATLDAGHKYRLLTLDWRFKEALYPGCVVWKNEETGNFEIAWPNENPNWDGGIEWLATFREEADANAFVSSNTGEQILTFVKRCDPENPDRFPGNENSYPGTTLQSVIRALIDRTTYLQGQIPCEENVAVINNLHNCLFLLEHRAMRRHGLDASQLTQNQASFGAMCPECGHVACNHEAESAPLISSGESRTVRGVEPKAENICAVCGQRFLSAECRSNHKSESLPAPPSEGEGAG